MPLRHPEAKGVGFHRLMKNGKERFDISLFGLYPGLLFVAVMVFCLCYGNPSYSGTTAGDTNNLIFRYVMWLPLVFGTLALASFFLESIPSLKIRALCSLAVDVVIILFLVYAFLAFFCAIYGYTDYFFDGDVIPGRFDEVTTDAAFPLRLTIFLLLFFLMTVPTTLNWRRFRLGKALDEDKEWMAIPLFSFGIFLTLVILLVLLFGVSTVADVKGSPMNLVYANLGVDIVLFLTAVFFLTSQKETNEQKLCRYSSLLCLGGAVLPVISAFVSIYYYNSGYSYTYADDLGDDVVYVFGYFAFYWSVFVYAAAGLLSLLSFLYFHLRKRQYD
jgi:hypothetical protein